MTSDDLTAIAGGKLRAGVRSGVGYLLLDQGHRLNALDEEMLEGIERQVHEWEASALHVWVLGSTSERALCAGADLARLATFDAAAMRRWESLGNRVLSAVQESPLVSVAATPGLALGGGLTLALACDFRLSADSAQFAQPEIGLGWIPGWGGVRRLARVAGAQAAKRLCMTGERIGAAEALRLGIVDRAVPSAQLDGALAEFASGLAEKSAEALRAIKALSADGAAAAVTFDAMANAALLDDPRGQAAIAAFLARKGSK